MNKNENDITKDQKDLVIENLIELINRLKLEVRSKDNYANQLERQLQLVKQQERSNLLRQPKIMSVYGIKEPEEGKTRQKEDLQRINWWPRREEVLKFFNPSSKEDHSICLKCNGIYWNKKLVHHYRKHINDEVRQKEKSKGSVEKINKQASSEQHSKKFILDKKSNKYQCFICNKLFKLLGTGAHWYSHVQRGETTSLNKGNFM